MKIAFIGPGYPWRGGIAEFIMKMAEKVHQKNHEVKIFSLISQYPKFLFPGKDQIEYTPLSYPFEIEKVFTPYDLLTWNKGVNRVLEWKPDLVIMKYWIPFFAPMYGMILRKLRKRKKTKVLYVIDNIDFHEKWFFSSFLTRYALKRADYLVSMSKTVYDSIFRIIPEYSPNRVIQLFHPNYEITRIPEDQVDNSFDYLNVPKKKTVLFFGYIKHYKGLDILIRSFKKVVERIDDIQLLIAGEVYGNDSQYTDLIKENGLDSHVVFHNQFIKKEDVSRYFAVSDVVVQPYRSATQSGISLLAFSYYKPVISTMTGGLTEIIQSNKNGILVPVENDNALSEAIIDFYEKYDRQGMVNFIKNEIDQYSWDQFMDTIIDYTEKNRL